MSISNKITLPKAIYSKEGILIAMQHYLEDYWIEIGDKKDVFELRINPKSAQAKLNLDEFNNILIESEFLAHRLGETKKLRASILSTTFQKLKK